MSMAPLERVQVDAQGMQRMGLSARPGGGLGVPRSSWQQVSQRVSNGFKWPTRSLPACHGLQGDQDWDKDGKQSSPATNAAVSLRLLLRFMLQLLA